MCSNGQYMSVAGVYFDDISISLLAHSPVFQVLPIMISPSRCWDNHTLHSHILIGSDCDDLSWTHWYVYEI